MRDTLTGALGGVNTGRHRVLAVVELFCGEAVDVPAERALPLAVAVAKLKNEAFASLNVLIMLSKVSARLPTASFTWSGNLIQQRIQEHSRLARIL